jgi:ribosome maturation factor RimP
MAAQKEAAMGSGDERRLHEVVTEVTTAAGYDLEELVVRSAGRRRVVRVVIDSDHGVSLDEAAAISRAISERLDEAGEQDPAGSEPYTLEVTSPGIGRPLTLPRHFRRARTRLVALVTGDGKTVTGHVLAVSDAAVTLIVPARKGVGTGIKEIDVPFADIERAKVEVEFNHPPAAVLALLGVSAPEEPDELTANDEEDEDEDLYEAETEEEAEEEASPVRQAQAQATDSSEAVNT